MVTKHPATKKKPAKNATAKHTGRAVAPKKLKRTFIDDLIEIGYRIPDEELAKLPTDLAKNFDHYAHGSPKQD